MKKVKLPVTDVIPVERIENKIYYIRGQKMMLDRDLAVLYRVPTKRLKEQVKRNLKRFPEDFMFELTWEELECLRSQIATLKRGQHSKYLAYAFTEQGIAMLSSVLNSIRAIEVNIQIIRVFTRLRTMLNDHAGLKGKIKSMERKYDSQFKVVFDAIRNLIDRGTRVPLSRRIGFLR